MKPRVLLLSAYDARSHQRWRERLCQLFPDYRWQQLVLPPRHFNWRIRGNSLHWAFSERELLRQNYDLLLATSMVDLASLRGLQPALAAIPSIVYFHENQFAYPRHRQRPDNIEPLLVPLYAALCADRVVFNSEYNRHTFLEGARSLFKALPEKLPAGIMEALQASEVIPVPLPEAVDAPRSPGNPELLEVVWNHRWEYDKGIGLLLEVVRRVGREKLPLRLNLVGEQFRQRPPEFEAIDQLLETQARARGCSRGEFGFLADEKRYRELLGRCDVALSTALHDFQGLALQEAVAAGCTPLAPADLVYPEYLEPQYLYRRGASDADTAAGICSRLEAWAEMKQAEQQLPRPGLEGYQPAAVRQRYAALFNELMPG